MKPASSARCYTEYIGPSTNPSTHSMVPVLSFPQYGPSCRIRNFPPTPILSDQDLHTPKPYRDRPLLP